MSLDTATTAIIARCQSQWSESEGVKYPNTAFARPVDANGNAKAFVALEIMWNGGHQVEIGNPGNNRMRRDGLIWTHAFVPIHSGIARAGQLLSAMGEIFEAKDFSNVDVGAMSPGGTGDADDDGLYWRESASFPFSYDEAA